MSKANKLRAWLERSENGTLLESQIIGSGMNAAIDELLLSKVVTMEDHPSVIDRRTGRPVACVVLRDQSTKEKD